MAGPSLAHGLQCSDALPSARAVYEVPTDTLAFDMLAGHLKSEYVAIKEADAVLQSHRTRWMHHLEYWMRQQESFISEIKFGQPPADIQDEELPPVWQHRLQAVPVHAAMDEIEEDFAVTSSLSEASARGTRGSQRPEQQATYEMPVPEERLPHADKEADSSILCAQQHMELQRHFASERSCPYALYDAGRISASGDSCDSISLGGEVQDTGDAITCMPLSMRGNNASQARRNYIVSLDMIDAELVKDEQSAKNFRAVPSLDSTRSSNAPKKFGFNFESEEIEHVQATNFSARPSKESVTRSNDLESRRRHSLSSILSSASNYDRATRSSEFRPSRRYSRDSGRGSHSESHRSSVPLCSVTLGIPLTCLSPQLDNWVHFVISMLINCRKDLRSLRRSWVKKKEFWLKALKVSPATQRSVNIFGVQPGQAKIQQSRGSWQSKATSMRGSAFPGADMQGRRSTRMTHTKIDVDLNAQLQDSDGAKCNLIMNPTSPKRLSWVFMGMALMLYDLIAFPLTVFDPGENDFTRTMKYFSQTYWTIDIIISFITGVSINGELVMKPLKIAQQYAKTWLTFDCLVTFPLWIIILLGLDSGSSSSVRSVRYVRMLRFLRLMRLAKFEHLMGEALEFVNSSTVILSFGIVKLMVYLTLLNHFNACLWYAVGNNDKGWADPLTGHVAGRPIIYKYLCAMHWALTQFQGTSEILPGKTLGERLYAAAFLTLALMILALFVSSLTNLKMQLQGLKDERNRISRSIRAYLTGNKISTALSIRVKKYVEWKLQQVSQQENDEVLKILPRQLVVELFYEVRGPALVLHRFFEMMDQYYSKVFRRLCQQAVIPMAFAPTELIFSPSDDAKYTYFVTSGRLRYRLIRSAEYQASEMDSEFAMASHGLNSGLHTMPIGTFQSEKSTENKDDDFWTCEVAKGEWLSEATLWVDWEHCGHLQAISDTAMVAMDAQEFEAAVTSHTQAHATAVLYARRFWTALNKYGKVYTDYITDPLFVDLDLPIAEG